MFFFLRVSKLLEDESKRRLEGDVGVREWSVEDVDGDLRVILLSEVIVLVTGVSEVEDSLGDRLNNGVRGALAGIRGEVSLALGEGVCA